MIRAVLLIAIAVLIAGCASAGANEIGTFRGLQFGVDLRQRAARCRSDAPITALCWEPPPACSGADCGRPWSVVFVDSLNDIFFHPQVEQHDDKLVATTAQFRGSDLRYIENLFIAKYGKAVTETHPTDAATAVRHVWQWKGLRIELQLPAADANVGTLSVATLTYAQQKKRAAEADFHKQLDDL